MIVFYKLVGAYPSAVSSLKYQPPNNRLRATAARTPKSKINLLYFLPTQAVSSLTEWVLHWTTTCPLWFLWGSNHATCSTLKRKTLKSPVDSILWSFFNNFTFYLLLTQYNLYQQVPHKADSMKYVENHTLLFASEKRSSYLKRNRNWTALWKWTHLKCESFGSFELLL